MRLPASTPAALARRRVLAAVAVALLVLTVALGFGPARSLSLSGDETASVRVIAQATPRDVLRQVRVGESTPPGWYLAAWALHRAESHAGDRSFIGLRMFSLLCAGLAAALTALLAARLLPVAAAALAGLMTSLSTVLFWHSIELRAYALFVLLATFYAFVTLLTSEDPRWWKLVLVAASVGAGILTHYFFGLAVIAGLAWLLVCGLPRSTRLKLAAAQLAGLLAIVPWLPAFEAQERAHRFGWIPQLDASRFGYLVSDLVLDPRLATGSAAVARGALGIVCVIGAVILWRSRAGRLVALMALLPIATAAALTLEGHRVFDLRNLIGVLPFVCVAIAAAISRLRPYLAVAVGAALVCLLVASAWMGSTEGRTSSHRIAQALTSLGWNRGDPIVGFGIAWGHGTIGWYLPGHPELMSRPVAAVACRPFYAVIESRSGLDWYHRHPAAAGAAVRIPSYGTLDHGRLQPWPLIVARYAAAPASLSAREMHGQRRAGAYIARSGVGGCAAAPS